MNSILQENKELFEYLEKNAGKPIKTLQDIDYLYDALFIEVLSVSRIVVVQKNNFKFCFFLHV
jgi:phage-related protein